jgi:hypothetical protein
LDQVQNADILREQHAAETAKFAATVRHGCPSSCRSYRCT